MSMSAIVWPNSPQMSFEKLIPEDASQRIEFIHAKQYSEVLDLLEDKKNIGMVITSLCPTDLQALYQVQKIQELYPNVTLFAYLGKEGTPSIAAGIDVLPARYKKFQKDEEGLDDLSESDNEDDDGTSLFLINENDITGKEGLCHLTPRQQEVLHCLMLGKSNKIIARELDLSEGTVKIHCMAIFRELGVSNRTQAAMLAEQLFPQNQKISSEHA